MFPGGIKFLFEDGSSPTFLNGRCVGVLADKSTHELPVFWMVRADADVLVEDNRERLGRSESAAVTVVREQKPHSVVRRHLVYLPGFLELFACGHPLKVAGLP
jgi:hypothetical protein